MAHMQLIHDRTLYSLFTVENLFEAVRSCTGDFYLGDLNKWTLNRFHKRVVKHFENNDYMIREEWDAIPRWCLRPDCIKGESVNDYLPFDGEYLPVHILRDKCNSLVVFSMARAGNYFVNARGAVVIHGVECFPCGENGNIKNCAACEFRHDVIDPGPLVA